VVAMFSGSACSNFSEMIFNPAAGKINLNDI
jgi:hypothetical protein